MFKGTVCQEATKKLGCSCFLCFVSGALSLVICGSNPFWCVLEYSNEVKCFFLLQVVRSDVALKFVLLWTDFGDEVVLQWWISYFNKCGPAIHSRCMLMIGWDLRAWQSFRVSGALFLCRYRPKLALDTCFFLNFLYVWWGCKNCNSPGPSSFVAVQDSRHGQLTRWTS